MQLKNFCILFLILIILTSCGKKSDNKGIELNVKLMPEKVTDFLFLKMNYNFNLSDEFKGLDKNYRIFVHFWRAKNKEMLLQDDHLPIKSTTEWKTGKKYNYSREIFIPKFLDEFDIDFEGYEEIKLTVGLYDPKKQDEKIALFKKTLNIQSVSLNAPEIIYDEGWWQPETNLKIKNPDERNWRWTSKKSVCIVENPKKECVLIIRGAIRKSMFKDQKVIIKINDQVLDEFVPETDIFSKKYITSPKQTGNQDEFNLIIETDKTFIPSKLNPKNKDNRELGIQIFFLYFREAYK